jgi:cell division protein FtsB
MRDISRRIQRYRLSRYAPPDDPVRRRLRWFWPVALLWLIWTTALSDHSLLRILSLQRDQQRIQRELADTREERATLETRAKDPKATQREAERQLREENGMARPGETVYQVRDVSPDSVGR